MFVDTGEADLDAALDARGFAEEHRCQRNGVDAKVEERAASQSGIKETAPRLEGYQTPEVCGQHADIADDALIDQFARADHRREKAYVHRVYNLEVI